MGGPANFSEECHENLVAGILGYFVGTPTGNYQNDQRRMLNAGASQMVFTFFNPSADLTFGQLIENADEYRAVWESWTHGIVIDLKMYFLNEDETV